MQHWRHMHAPVSALGSFPPTQAAGGPLQRHSGPGLLYGSHEPLCVWDAASDCWMQASGGLL